MDEYLLGRYLNSLPFDRINKGGYLSCGYQHKMKDGKMDRKAPHLPRGHDHDKRRRNKARRQAIKRQRAA